MKTSNFSEDQIACAFVRRRTNATTRQTSVMSASSATRTAITSKFGTRFLRRDALHPHPDECPIARPATYPWYPLAPSWIRQLSGPLKYS